MNSTHIDNIFKRYDVRGIYPTEFNEDIAFQIGHLFAQLLGAQTVAVGRDMRESGSNISRALIAGINHFGASVVDIGLVSTDALYFAVGHYGYDGGIMVTASHNPAKYNGLKFTGKNAEPMSLDTGLAVIRDRITPGYSWVSSSEETSVVRREVLEDFAKHCLSFVDVSSIKPLKIAIDAGNGMGGKIVPAVFKFLPCEVIPLFFELDGTFPNHPANPLEPENIRDLQHAILKNKCDLGVAFDGDADRMFILDETAKPIGGDILTALVAINTLKSHPGQKILYNVVCSKTVKEIVIKHKGEPVRSPVGHSLIKKIMRDEDVIFGGEHSGHFYFKDNWYADSGIIALLQCLQVFSESQKNISEIVAALDTRFRSGEVNRTVKHAPSIIQKISEHYKDGMIDRLDGVTIEYPNWWVNIRSSNTEPLLRVNVEADTQSLMDKSLNDILALIEE